ncbi:DUF2059 domain-containing protein [Sphingomonas sp. AP4-R1]|uniref:DUF2059 domain-containing protein n=1 Tax=Sphingomonas sp. AP4-R1 TaxID=2735134 RepID=UPI00149352EA|nr:DUF2059 domain-containing protein [Sphingomonas sp. AP4-R1]QJU57007.1 DUF2059 domain-containing protein [Sphingomonas sp. AP4-R1]
MKTLAAFLIAAPIAALPLPVAAQAPAAAPATDAAAKPVDPAAQAAARELFEASDIGATMRDTSAKMLAQMRSGAALSVFVDQNPQMRMKRATNPQAWDAALVRLGTKQAAAVEKIMAELQPEMEARTIRIYAETFTIADLKGFAAFYRTPLGRRMVEKMPTVLNQTMGWMQAELPKRVAPAMAELQPEIQRELAPLMSAPK